MGQLVCDRPISDKMTPKKLPLVPQGVRQKSKVKSQKAFTLGF
ncbi:hypothetical protein NSP_14760 [Nodularia spumigena CCY9414]|nr:hypothetical protein NSP_14760 [Nodularia spumigena CCY9414]